jgi:uncharacterized membrane protein
MANVTVWQFDSPGGAAGALTRLQTLEVEGMVEIVDVAIVEWADDLPAPRMTPFRSRGLRQLGDQPGSGRLRRVFAGGPKDADVSGLDDAFVERFRERVTPGTSALCMVVEAADRKQLLATLGSGLRHAQLVETNLSPEDEAGVRAMLADV